ncbi:MAG: sensor histidine kinase [Lachnospiraceae bacterium]|nr:sensor histidine kinase [Lachnospiraceae bacterium]
MRILKNFLKEESKNIVLCIAGYALCAVVLVLYDALTEALLYGGVLYLLMITLVFTVRYIRYARHALRRREYLEGLECGQNTGFEPDSDGEAQMCDRIEELYRKIYALITDTENIRRDHNDYYTVWVHQIKTPIAAMKMMLARDDTKENRELASELFRIEQYVDMALGYIRIGCDTNDLVIAEYSVDEMVRQAVRKFAPLFVERRLKLDYEPADIRISTDEKWFVFVIEQILSNAIKYTKQGGISIGFDNGQLVISDTGMGIAPGDLPRIFEKGYTGFNGRADKKATGLGLYLCRRVCDMLSLTIRAESEEGKGSRFFIDLSQRKLKQD